MTVKTNFLQNGTYNAVDLVNEFGALFTDGMLSGGAVTAHSPASLSADVAALKCLKEGLFLNSDATENVAIVTNTSGYNRIDVIAADLDNNTIVAVQGTPSSSPTAPILSGNKIALCQVLVGNNVSVINQINITDVRVNVDLFGSQLAAVNSQLADKANIAQESYITPTLLNGWVAQGDTNTRTAGYLKDTLGFVHIIGAIKKTTAISSGEVLFNLPVGYRPGYTRSFLIYNAANVARVDIQTNGNIVIQTTISGGLPYVPLDQMIFLAGA